jgi:hypothetical protein
VGPANSDRVLDFLLSTLKSSDPAADDAAGETRESAA